MTATMGGMGGYNVGAVVATIRLNTAEAIKGADKFTATVKGMAGKIQAHALQIQGLGLALTGIGAGAVMLGKQLVGAAGQMERYQAQFEVLTGSVEAAQERIQKLVAFAAKTPFDLPGIIEADKLVQAFGLDLGGLEKTMTTFGDAAAAMGIDISQVIRNFAKLQAGMFDMAEMAPLGITRDKLREFGVQFTKTGEVINREDLFPAAIKLIEKFAGTMDKVSQTTEGALSNLGDSFFQLKATFGATVAPIVQEWVRSTTTAIEGVQKWATANPELTATLVQVGLKIGLVCAALGPFLILLPSLVSGIGLVVAAITSPIGLIVALLAIIPASILAEKALDAYTAAVHRAAEVRLLAPAALLKQVKDAEAVFEAYSIALSHQAKLELDSGNTLKKSNEQWLLRKKYVGEATKEEIEYLTQLNTVRYWTDEYSKAQEKANTAVSEFTKGSEAAAGGGAGGGAGGKGVKLLATRLEEAAKKVKELRSEVARLPAGKTAWAEATEDLNEALAEFNRLLATSSDDIEAILPLFDRWARSIWAITQTHRSLTGIAPVSEGVVRAYNAMTAAARAFADETKPMEFKRAPYVMPTLETTDITLTRERLAELYEEWKYASDERRLVIEAEMTAITDKLGELKPKMKTVADAVSSIWLNTWARIENTFADVIFGTMKGIGDLAKFAQSAFDAILQALAQIWANKAMVWLAKGGGIGDIVATIKASPELLQALSYFGAGVTVFEAASGNWVRAAVSLVATIALQRMAAAAQVSAAAGQASAAVTQVAAATSNSVAAGISTVAATASVTAGGVMAAAMGVGVAAAVGMAAAAATMMAAAVIMAGVNVGLGLFGLQHGGVVMKPTVALLGEAGPERVIPLTGPHAGWDGAGLGSPVVLNQRVNLSVDSLDESGIRRLMRRGLGAVGHEVWRARMRRGGGRR